MSDRPTSAQYALGVGIGHLMMTALKAGATEAEILSTLDTAKFQIRSHFMLADRLAPRPTAPAAA